MTFEQVLVFHKIIQSGSFKAAAAELHKTQPAISLAIKKLEEEMEVDLFDRSHYRPVLTEHGKSFYERSLKTLQSMQELEGLTQSFRHKEEPEIKIAVDGISPLPKILGHFRRFNEKYPFTKLNLEFDILSGAERRVLDKEAQFGVTHFISETNALDIVPITHVTMVPVMCRELHEELNLKKEEQLLDVDQIVVGDRKGSKGTSFGLLDGGKKWRLTDNNFKRELIMAGLGWGHLPEHQIIHELKDKKLVVIDFENIHPRKLTINLIRLKKHSFGIVSRSLWEDLTSLQD